MKKLLLVSKEWFPDDKTGLGISSNTHYEIFLKNGYDIKKVSIKKKTGVDYNLYFSNLLDFFLSFFSLKKKADHIIKTFQPDYVIIESLQTCISELFLILSYKKKTKLILISHGISILPYKYNLKYIIRFLIYLFYLPVLVFLMKKVDIFFSLNHTDSSDRHLDEKIYKLIGKKKIKKYFNTSRYENEIYKCEKNIKSRKIITCIGYLGEIKNQIEFLKISEKLNDLNLEFQVVYQNYNKKYLDFCKKFCLKKKLKNIYFTNGNKENIKNIIARSHLIINTSVTEVFPLSIVESINLGTPFISYDTGNTSYIKGGLIAENHNEMINIIKTLVKNDFFYDRLKILGKNFYKQKLNFSLLELKLTDLI